MTTREHNFISAVIYIKEHPDLSIIESILKNVDSTLTDHFDLCEIICCMDGDAQNTLSQLRMILATFKCPAVSIIRMGRKQGVEAAMNAGVDAAVGDYVLEIDDIRFFDSSFILRAYEESCRGADIVIGEAASSSLRGKMFYPLFNSFSNASYKLKSSSCSLASRRALNRVRAISEYTPYRKASYASSGLTIVDIPAGGSSKSPHESRLNLAMDSLALYTDSFYKISFGLALAMVLISLAELIYAIATYCLGLPVGGWTTTMLAISFGFLGVFILLTFILKYAALILKLQMSSNNYLIEDIEKLGR